MTEREELLQNVRKYDFAVVDTVLFLDGHPHNANALAFYREMSQRLAEAKKKYEEKFGPLGNQKVDVDTEWSWIHDPWPWEGADN